MKSNIIKHKKTMPAVVKAPLVIPYSKEITEEIKSVIDGVRFNKIGFPLSAYRYMVDDTVSEDDERIITIGFIKFYNNKSNEFTLSIFAQYAGIISKIDENPAVVPQITSRNNKLGTIVKFILANIDEEEYEEDDDYEEVDTSEEAVEEIEENEVEEEEIEEEPKREAPSINHIKIPDAVKNAIKE